MTHAVCFPSRMLFGCCDENIADKARKDVVLNKAVRQIEESKVMIYDDGRERRNPNSTPSFQIGA